ncbi:MAG: anti-sigma factor [Betaproteobacteria bacterium]
MNLSRPDRLPRLDALAAEYALGTLSARARSRLARMARDEDDGAVAAAIRNWEMRLAPLAASSPPIAPPPRVWSAIARRLGLASATAADRSDVPWWSRIAFWRSFALTSFALALAFGVSLFSPVTRVVEPPIVAVLAGPDAKPALIATVMRGERTMTVKVVGAATVPPGKSLELWMLADSSSSAAPRSLGVIPDSGMAKVVLPATDISLANVPALAVSLEPAGGSPTGVPTGPVLYSGKVERFY